MKTKALDRDSRKHQIMLAFAVNLQSGGDGRLTLVDIAHKVGLAHSTKLRKMVEELIAEGLLTSKDEPMTGAVSFRRVYSPTALFDSRNGKAKREPRSIVFRAKENGQLSIWSEVVS